MTKTIQAGRRLAQMQKKNIGEIHTRPALSVIGPKIRGIKLSADDKIKVAIRALRESDKQEYDTFEEADDFDVPDDVPDPTSQYEMTEMQQDYEFEPETGVKKQEERIPKKSAPKEAPPKEGADETKDSLPE